MLNTSGVKTFTSRKLCGFREVRKARIRESLCSLNILISFIRERLCHFILFSQWRNWNIWSKTIIYFKRALFQGSLFQPREVLGPGNIWFQPKYESLFLAKRLSSCHSRKFMPNISRFFFSENVLPAKAFAPKVHLCLNTRKKLSLTFHFLFLSYSIDKQSFSSFFVLDANPVSANPTKWSNTLKQFVGKSYLEHA